MFEETNGIEYSQAVWEIESENLRRILHLSFDEVSDLLRLLRSIAGFLSFPVEWWTHDKDHNSNNRVIELAELLDIHDSEVLRRAIASKCLQIKREERDILVPLPAQQIKARLDGLAVEIYRCIFYLLLDKANHSQGGDIKGHRGNNSELIMLSNGCSDDKVNDFEGYLAHCLEERVYHEYIPNTDIEFNSATHSHDLESSKVLDLLDDLCPVSLCAGEISTISVKERFRQFLSSNSLNGQRKRHHQQEGQFIVKHYHQVVTYTIENFAQQSRLHCDSLSKTVLQLSHLQLASSACQWHDTLWSTLESTFLERESNRLGDQLSERFRGKRPHFRQMNDIEGNRLMSALRPYSLCRQFIDMRMCLERSPSHIQDTSFLTWRLKAALGKFQNPSQMRALIDKFRDKIQLRIAMTDTAESTGLFIDAIITFFPQIPKFTKSWAALKFVNDDDTILTVQDLQKELSRWLLFVSDTAANTVARFFRRAQTKLIASRVHLCQAVSKNSCRSHFRNPKRIKWRDFLLLTPVNENITLTNLINDQQVLYPCDQILSMHFNDFEVEKFIEGLVGRPAIQFFNFQKEVMTSIWQYSMNFIDEISFSISSEEIVDSLLFMATIVLVSQL